MLASATRASFHVLLGNFMGKGINYIALLFCTPHLGPEGFAALLTVGIITAIFGVVVDVGFEHFYLIKVNITGKDISDPLYVQSVEDMVFRVRVISNILLASLQLLLSWLLLDVYFSYPTNVLLQIMSLHYLFSIFGKINEARLRKRLMFNLITKAKVVSDIAGAICKIVLVIGFNMAIIGWVWGAAIAVLFNNLILAISGKYKPTLKPLDANLKKEARWFAKHSWLIGIGIYLQQQLSSIIIKATYPLNQVGLFQFGVTYSIDLQSGILAPQGQVLISYFTNHKNNPNHLLSVINRLGAIYLMLMGPIILFIFLFTDHLINDLLGSEWMASVPIVRALLLYCLFRTIVSPAVGIMAGLGKMRQSSILSFFNALGMAAGLLICYIIKVPIAVFAIVYVVFAMLGELSKVVWGFKLLSIPIIKLFMPHTSNAISLFVLFIVLFVLRYYLPNQSTPLHMSLGILAIGMFYLAAVLRKDPIITDLFTSAKHLLPKKTK